MMVTDTELHDKLKLFIAKLDRMESRIKEVEALAANIPVIEATLSKIDSRIDIVESHDSHQTPSDGGGEWSVMFSQRSVLIGLVLAGLLALAWIFL